VQQSTTQLSKASFYILRMKQARTHMINEGLFHLLHTVRTCPPYLHGTQDESQKTLIIWNWPLGFSYELLKRYHYLLSNNTASSPTDNKNPVKVFLIIVTWRNFSDHHWLNLGIDNHGIMFLHTSRAIKPNQRISSWTAQLQFGFDYSTV
jgi:hypothetical protein